MWKMPKKLFQGRVSYISWQIIYKISAQVHLSVLKIITSTLHHNFAKGKGFWVICKKMPSDPYVLTSATFFHGLQIPTVILCTIL